METLMAIKFEKIEPGMTLHDIHSERMGNTTMSELGKWPVYIVSVDKLRRVAVVKWNGNKEEIWYERDLKCLYAEGKEPKRYREQQERNKKYGRY
jgi:hypothetical protein